MSNDTNSNGAPRRKLSDILNGSGNTLRDAWDSTAAATEFSPLPASTYIARIVRGELGTSKGGTPGYKLTFRVLEGEHAGRQFWNDIWLTAAALPMAKRDLAKLGVVSLEQLEHPLPPGIRCRVKLALRREDDGTEFNRVRSFEVLGVDPIDDDDFAPTALSGKPTVPPAEKAITPATPATDQPMLIAPRQVSAQEGGR
jgi:hypothetical protein